MSKTSKQRNPSRRKRRRSGLTLLEVILAVGLIVLLSSTLFMFYDSTVRARQRGTRMIVDTQLARVVAMKIAEEVRSANGFLSGTGPGISGTERMLKLQTVVLTDPKMVVQRSVKDNKLPGQSDIRQVQYYLAYDEDEQFDYPDGVQGPHPLGLVRREVKTMNQVVIDETKAEQVDLDLLAPELQYVRFRYFDGVDWLDKWDIGESPEGGMGNSLPQAVEITVGYTPVPPPQEEEKEDEDPDLKYAPPEPYASDRYTITVRLPQADTFFGSRLMRASRRAGRKASSGS